MVNPVTCTQVAPSVTNQQGKPARKCALNRGYVLMKQTEVYGEPTCLRWSLHVLGSHLSKPASLPGPQLALKRCDLTL